MRKDKRGYQILRTEIKDTFLQSKVPSKGTRCVGKEQCGWVCSTTLLIILFYFFSITLTFYNQRFIRHFRFPLSITMTHLLTKFCISSFFRWVLYMRTGKERVTLAWKVYFLKVAPPGVASSLDIGLSNWSFEYISISLYTMTKTTCIIFILLFSLLFRLEKFRVSLVAIISFIAIGLFMFTYESTQFHPFGFCLVLTASFISGLRWTLNQIVLQRKDIGLGNPIDMMYHIQPWMVLSLLPLSSGFEVMRLATSEQAFGYENTEQMVLTMAVLLAGAVLAFLLEFSEFMVLSYTSGLTLSVAGIFKEVIVLLLAALLNGDRMSAFNAAGLVFCLLGILLHILFKYRQSAEEGQR